MLRKGISVLLAIVMVIGVLLSLPFTTFAEKTEVAVTASQQDDIVNIAKSQLGVQERSSGSDNVIYNDWYYGHSVSNYNIKGYVYGISNPTYPWCAAFVSWCAEQAGISKSVIPKSAGTRILWNNIDVLFSYFLSITSETVIIVHNLIKVIFLSIIIEN